VPGLVIGVDDVVENANTVTQHIDLTYTVASLTGVRTDQFEGRDLRDPSRPFAISQRGIAHLNEYTKHDETFDTSPFFKHPFTSIRTTQWKYQENEERRVLYALPDEDGNVIGEHPEVASELSQTIAEENIDWTQNPEAESFDFDEEVQDQLRDLGYLT
jgi:uncharacterized sulfatase